MTDLSGACHKSSLAILRGIGDIQGALEAETAAFKNVLRLIQEKE